VRTGIDPFNFVPNDHELVVKLFPFRNMPRDLARFMLVAHEHGGVPEFYASSRRTIDKMMEDRGYYFISEQSRSADERLPDGFHVDTDEPESVDVARANVSLESTELRQLRDTINQHHISCFYIPYYRRSGTVVQPPEKDDAFAQIVSPNVSCKVLGPRYFTYPPALFSDPLHLNREGARIYTLAIYQLLAEEWEGKH
jgi:hypothetical protein